MKLKYFLTALLLLLSFCYYQHTKISKLDSELGIAVNNNRYYESLISNHELENRVLLLTIDLLNNSSDSLIKEISKVRKELKVKSRNLKLAQVINTEMKDTVYTTVEAKLFDFTKELKLNDLTTITVSKKDSILTAILDLNNLLILIVEEKREYRNKYKNGWQRFWHFDWKKDKNLKYQIKNTNNLIKVTDTRIIQINN